MSGSHYPGKEVKIVNSFSGNPSFDNYKLDDVLAAYKSLPRYGDFIAVTENNKIKEDPYTGIHNHFQGIQRLKGGNRFVISGGSQKDHHAHLFIVKLSYFHLDLKNRKSLPRRFKTGPVGSNVLIKEKIPGVDVLEDIICLETGRYWHAGGISLSGDILAVPLENRDEDKSVIAFYNFNNVKKVQRLKNMIIRSSGKCGAVALTQLQDGRLLCVSWSDDDNKPDRFEIYISKSSKRPFLFGKAITVNYRDVKNKPEGKSKFQSIQLLQQKDGKLFLFATQNTNKLAPKFNGNNEALLFQLKLGETPKRTRPTITFLIKRRFAQGGSYFNFAAACGVFVNKQNKLALYSGHHWRNKKRIRFAEFWTEDIAEEKKITEINDAVIQLFEDKNFKKRKVNIYGNRFAQLKKYDNLFVHGGYFDDKVSSIRYMLPEGTRYRLYDDAKFNAGSKNKNHLTLIGTGYLESISDLSQLGYKGLKFARNFGDKTSSSEYL